MKTHTPSFSGILLASFVAASSAVTAISVDAKVVQRPHKEAAPVSKQKVGATRGQWNWPSALMVGVIERVGDGKFRFTELPDTGHNQDVKVPIASLTKNMTAFLVFEAMRTGKMAPDRTIPILPESLNLPDSRFATYFLKGDKEISVADALTHGLKISSNPMMYNLAVAHAGSEKSFVELMNKKAAELGMKDTYFLNSHGLPLGNRTEEYTTARDQAILATALLEYADEYRSYAGAPLEINGRSLETTPKSKFRQGIEKIKGAIRDAGGILKTATINGCKSLVTVRPSPVTSDANTSSFVTIQLCTKEERFKEAESLYQQAPSWLQRLKRTFTTAANSSDNPSLSLPATISDRAESAALTPVSARQP